MNRVSRLWQELTPDAHLLLQSVQTCFETQPMTGTWTDEQRSQAERLVPQLRSSWNQQRVDLEALGDLRSLTADLDLAGTLTSRAALETIHGHFRRLVELTGDALAVED